MTNLTLAKKVNFLVTFRTIRHIGSRHSVYIYSSVFNTEPRLRLSVFHTAVRYGKRHVKLIETSAEERDTEPQTELHINIIQPIIMNIEYIIVNIYTLLFNKTQEAQNVHQLGGGGLMFNLRFNIL